jgi:hypothetical protein
MRAGGARTRHMTSIFSRMKAKASGVRSLLNEFEQSSSAGNRLAGIAVLQMFPSVEHVDWLAERLDNPELEKPFVGYQAAIALLEAARTLPRTDCDRLKTAVEKAKLLAEKMPDDPDRLLVLEAVEQELFRKCSGN